MIFFLPTEKKAFPEFSTAKIHGTNVCDTANSEEKKSLCQGEKKKYKLDFRKGHFGQGTWKKKKKKSRGGGKN